MYIYGFFVWQGAAFSHSQGCNVMQQGVIWAIRWSEAEAITLCGPVQVVEHCQSQITPHRSSGVRALYPFRKSNYECPSKVSHVLKSYYGCQ